MEYLTYTPRALEEADYSRVDPLRVGRGLEGRGNKGVGGGAGSNPIKADAINKIYERGYGGGNDPNAWDEGDIGMVGKLTGVTIEDLQNKGKSAELSVLKNDFDRKFEALGSTRRAQWGDTAEGLNLALADAQESYNLKRTEPGRIRTEQRAEDDRVKAVNEQRIEQNRVAQNQTNQFNLQLKGMNDQMALTREQLRDSRAENELERISRAEDNKMQLQIEMARMDQQDRRAQENLQLRREEFRENRRAELFAGIDALAKMFLI